MRESCTSQARIRKACQHCRLYRRHDFAGGSANHRKTEDAVVAVADKCLHEALRLISRLRSEDGVHWQLCDTSNDTLAFRLPFAKPYMGKRWIGEHAIRNQPAARAAICSRQIVAYDSKVVFGYVSELWAARAFPYRPYIWRTRFQPIVDANETARVQLDAGLIQANTGRIGNTPCGYQDIAAIDLLLSREGARNDRNFISGSPAYPKQFGFDKNSNTFAAENAPYLLRDIDILASQ
jgi:hypothetical protein